MAWNLLAPLNNVRMAFKVSAAPILVTVFMLAICGTAFFQAQSQKAELDHLVEVVLTKDREAAEVGLETMGLHATLYRFLSLMSNSAKPDKGLSGANQIATGIETITGRIRALRRFALNATEGTAIAAMEADVERYSKAVRYVIDMADADVAIAITFMLEADKEYSLLAGELRKLREVESTLTNTTIKHTTEAASRSMVLMAALLFLALTAATFVILVVSRAISAPIMNLTDAMTILAAGRNSVDIPGEERKDEIGAMARAVNVFKATAVEAERLSAERERQREAQNTRAERLGVLTGDFDSQVTALLSAVGKAASRMEAAAGGMSYSAEATAQKVSTAREASAHASARTSAMATAAEELSSSVNEIRRQVAEQSRIAQVPSFKPSPQT